MCELKIREVSKSKFSKQLTIYLIPCCSKPTLPKFSSICFTDI